MIGLGLSYTSIFGLSKNLFIFLDTKIVGVGVTPLFVLVTEDPQFFDYNLYWGWPFVNHI